MPKRHYKKAVIIGATSLIAEHCARHWVQGQLDELLLVGRSDQGLARVAADLAVRNPAVTLSTHTIDFLDPAAVQALGHEVSARGAPQLVLIAHGTLPDQADCQEDLQACRQSLLVNGVSPVLFAEAFAGGMERAGEGVLALIGSVAGDRGRRSNYLYGAAKGMVETYTQGLRHRLAAAGVQVVLVKPGPTRTPMTAHLPLSGLAPPATVAEQICRGVDNGRAVVYTPARWRLIMAVIRNLPAVIFNRLDI